MNNRRQLKRHALNEQALSSSLLINYELFVQVQTIAFSTCTQMRMGGYNKTL